MKALFLCILIFATSCAYRQGSSGRIVPGGATRVRVPLFQNKSSEVGIETAFTNALIDEISESNLARVEDEAPVEIRGVIQSVDDVRSGQKTLGQIGKDKWGMATDYRIVIVVDLSVVQKGDGPKGELTRGDDSTGSKTNEKILWSGQFTGERTFSASQVLAPGINSVNPLYNLSARRFNIAELAKDIIAEGSDRMTENF